MKYDAKIYANQRYAKGMASMPPSVSSMKPRNRSKVKNVVEKRKEDMSNDRKVGDDPHPLKPTPIETGKMRQYIEKERGTKKSIVKVEK